MSKEISLPNFASVLPFYIVTDNNKTKEYSTLIDIANDYKSNISNIYHLVEGKKVKNLDILQKRKWKCCFR